MKNVKNIKILILSLLLLVAFSACSHNKNDKLTIVTTIYPYELIVKQITQNKAEVFTIIPPNASPHTYSPLPSDIEKIGKADIVFSNGLDLELALDKPLSEIKKKHITLAEFIPKEVIMNDKDNHHDIDHEHNHDAEHEHEHSAGNPHIWLHPEMIIDIAKGITQTIANVDPKNRDFYENNLKDLILEMESLDSFILNERNAFHNPNAIFFHDSFAYFNARYNIKAIGFIQKSPGKEPLAKELKILADKIISNQTKGVFIEPQLNPKAANIIAKEFNLKVLKLDPLGTSLNINKISDLLLQNWEIMKKGIN